MPAPKFLDKLLNVPNFWFLLVIVLWLSFTAGWRPMALPDEGRYTGIAWEMYLNQDLLIPTLNGLPYFHKPPLFYWITTLGYALMGANYWALRLAPLLASGILVLVFFRFLMTHTTAHLAKYSVLILASQTFYFGASQFANLDLLVACLISITILSGYHTVCLIETKKNYRWILLLTYLSAALGVLAKGFIGCALPAIILLIWLIYLKKLTLLYKLISFWGLVLFLVISVPWFYYIPMKKRKMECEDKDM
ncbi:MAG: glycosyltransferase family 39 protein [Gammaproteobacteria bacterium]|nr:glycosyltransferase family 39 protein [Gammaproteobacteria bacterium]